MNSESTLLRSLDPRIFDDHGAAVSFGEGATLSRADLFAAATAVADRSMVHSEWQYKPPPASRQWSPSPAR